MYQTQEHFCRFYAGRHYRKGRYSAGTQTGYSATRLAFIRQGGCRIEQKTGETFRLSVGDVWFIPKGVAYTSYWEEGESAFDMTEFEVDQISLYYPKMQFFHLPALSADFDTLIREGEQKNDLACAAAFYQILNKVVPMLEKKTPASAERILPALNYLRDHSGETVTVEEVAELCHMSPSRFFEVFREAVGESPIKYKNKIRLFRAETLLLEGKTTEEVCELLNFSSPSFLRRMMKKYLGTTPRAIKTGQTI